jgi:hypothetical protein
MSSANRTRFAFDGKGVTTPAVAEVVEEDVAALRLATVALRGSDLRIPQKIQPAMSGIRLKDGFMKITVSFSVGPLLSSIFAVIGVGP